MMQVWAEVFDLQRDSPNLEDEVVACLQAMRSEMELMRTKLLAQGATDDLLHPGMTRLRNVASTANIHAGWNGLWEEVSRPENRIPLAWAKWVLREDDEDDMPSEELAGLRKELNALEMSFLATEMSPYMRGFIQRQIDAIRAALKLYPIRGIKPIEEAARQVVGTCNLEAPVLAKEFEKASEPAKSIFARTGQFIEKTAKVADNLDKIRKAGDGAYTLAASFGPMLVTWGAALTK